MKVAILYLALCICLASCASPTSKKISSDTAEIRALKDNQRDKLFKRTTQISDTTTQPIQTRAIEIPWLGEQHTINFHGLAKDAVAVVTSFVNKYYLFNVDNQPIDPSLRDLPPAAPAMVSLSGLMTTQSALNSIMTQADWSYRIDNDIIVITDTIIKTIPVSAVPGSQKARLTSKGRTVNSTSENGDSDQSSNDSNNSVFSIDIDPYKDLEEILNSISTQLRVYTKLSKATNMVTISGRPSKVRSVEALVKNYNKNVNKAVSLDIQIISIDKSDRQQLNFNFNANFKGSSTIKSLALANGIVTTTSDNGVQNVITALFANNATRVYNRPSVIAPNNQLISISEDNNVVNYLESVIPSTQSQGSTSRTSDQIKVGRIDGGTTLKIIPTISGNIVNLRLVYQQISNINFDSTSAGNVSLRLPTYTNRSIDLPIVNIRDGETVFIAGLSENTDTNNQTKNPLIPVLADNRTKNVANREIIIVVTANIIK